ncbi:MAG: hypothetical protein RL336_1040 [Pseudomonadota bacterium]|jgi:sugar phosphate isomerase/epimerase
MINIPSSRRFFLKSACALGALAGLPSALAHGGHARVGLQLYTVRDMASKNLLHTLEHVAALGYKDMEFAGYFDYSVQTLRRHLDVLGLAAPSAHIPLTAFQSDTDKVIDQALVMGHQYLVMPYLTDEQRQGGIDAFKRLAEYLNGVGEKCRQNGLFLAYHNHDFEFFETDGQLPYDVLLEVPSEHLLMEMDLYWTTKAGYDPVAYFEQDPGRFPLWHVKDMDAQGNFADVGSGTIDFERIFAHRHTAGLQHGFVERDVTDNLERTLTASFVNAEALMAKQ